VADLVPCQLSRTLACEHGVFAIDCEGKLSFVDMPYSGQIERANTLKKSFHKEIPVDNEMIGRCLVGDQNAWEGLISRYQRLVYSVAHTLCPRPEDVSDVFQQVWLELYEHLSDLRNVEALPAWLITVTRRRAYALINSARDSELLDAGIPDLSTRLNTIENEHAVERALAQLPERCRRLIDLLYFRMDEPSYAGIAKEMNMPVSSIGPTRARCLERLRKFFG
jgi:RNA polymerase sigma factor (sigma-70 family)